MTCTRYAAATVLMGLASLALVAPAAWADEVVLAQGVTLKQAIGGRVRGQITAESPIDVSITVGASTVKIPLEQIATVRYDGQSPNYQLAESRQTGGQLIEAVDLYKKAAADAAQKQLPLPLCAALAKEAEVLAELALIEPERVKEAETKLKAFIARYPQSRQINQARDALVRVQLHAGEIDQAATTIAELERIPQAADRAAILKTRLLVKQEKYSEAASELDRLIAAAPKGSSRRRAAVLAKAECMAGMKKFKEAEDLAREVILDSPPEDAEAQAPAYNTLGDCLRAANRPKDALLAYLHTDLLYSKDREEHPRALFQIAALFRKLKQDARADEFIQRLKQEYPKSPWVSAKPPQ